MPNIPYKNLDGYEPKQVLDAVIARRGGADKLMNLDRMLLHSPEIAEGWAAFFKKVRNELTLDPKLRELAVCAVAMLNDAEYEFHHHRPVWEKAGATSAQIEAIQKFDPAVIDTARFDTAERAVLRLAIEMTRQVKPTPETMAAARAVVANDRQMVELVTTIAAYNMVSRILVATGIEIEKA